MNRNKKIVKISIYGIILNILLVIFKGIVGFLSNSIAILLDAVNNLSDSLSAIITIIGIKLSQKKPDKKHPYGHGRIEYISAVIIGMIVLIAALTSLKESYEKIINPVKASYSILTILVVIVAILVKYFFGSYVKKQGKKLNSNNLIATGIDALSDSVLSLTTLIAALISIFFHISLEGYLGVIISLLILKSAIVILKDTTNDMIGVRADSNLTKTLRKSINKYKDVHGVYDLIIHSYGPNNIIATAHIEVDSEMTAHDIHRLTRNISNDIYEKMGIILTLGIYSSNNDKKHKNMYLYTLDLIKKYDNIMQLHAFYVDDAVKNVSFDLIFSFDEKNVSKIVYEIKEDLKAKYSDYEFFIIIDKDFSD